jgi:hypothetical protein
MSGRFYEVEENMAEAIKCPRAVRETAEGSEPPGVYLDRNTFIDVYIFFT